MVAKLSQLLDQNITSTATAQETAQGARQMAQKADSTARKAGKRAEDAGETAIRAGQTAELAGSTTQRAGTTAAQASATAQQAGTLAQQAGTTVTQVQSAMTDTGRGEVLETYGRPKPERVDAFTGGIHENVQTWLEKARNQSKGLFPTEAKQVKHVSCSLDHRALRWFNDEESSGHYFTQWEDFQDSIMEAFYDPSITRRLRSKLKQLQFRGNIERFTSEFSKLADQIPDMSQAEVVPLFLEKLPAHTQVVPLIWPAKSTLCMLMGPEWEFVITEDLGEIVDMEG
ncbi:hypothetical protein H4R33_007097, partial [Dimargaris cristalligena]